jgi:hypothetical protein
MNLSLLIFELLRWCARGTTEVLIDYEGEKDHYLAVTHVRYRQEGDKNRLIIFTKLDQ